MRSADHLQRGYRRRKTLIHAGLRATCFAAGAAAALLVVHASYDLSIAPGNPLDRSQWIEEHIKNFLRGLGSFLSEGFIEQLAAEYPYRTMALIGGVAGLVPSKVIAAWMYQRFFDTIDPHVLLPIGRPRGIAMSGEDPLSWVEPSGARLKAWGELLDWVMDGSSTGGGVRWCILVGRSGTGKTRTVHELAQRLARRDVFGAPDLREVRNRLFRAFRASSLACGAYVRNLAGRRRRDDPWDVGELHTAVRGDASHLVDWRPRRPTLLVLDDPVGGESTETLKVLRSQARAFRYPVRLLFVNQTIPSQLGLRLEKSGWQSKEADGRPPVQFTADARFTPGEVASLARQTLGGSTAALEWDHALRHFVKKTEGIPLLVELGLHWLKAKRPLDEMSREGLLIERAGKVIVALEQAKIDAGGVTAIAAATVCGGAPRIRLRKRLGSLPSPSVLAGAFPLDTEVLRDTLPAVRPEMIGDEFVRKVIDDTEDIAADVVEAAWIANPRGTLRAVLRLSSTGDALAAALTAGPPAWPGSRVELVGAYAENYVRTGRDFGPADRQIGMLDPTEAMVELPVFAGMLATPGARAGAGLACFARLLGQALLGPGLFTRSAEFTRALRETADAIRWGQDRGYRSGSDLDCLVEAVCSLLGRASALPHVEDAGALEEARDAHAELGNALWVATDLHGPAAISIMEALAGVPFIDSVEQIRLRVRVLAMRGEGEEALKVAERLHGESGGDASLAGTVAEVWSFAAFAHRGIESLASARKLEWMALQVAALQGRPFHRSVALYQARILADAAYVCATSLEDGASGVAESMAAQVDLASTQFPGDPDLQLVRVDAWRWVASAYSTQEGGAEHAEQLAQRVEELGGRFATAPAFVLRRARTWRYVCGGYSGQEGGVARSVELAEYVDTLGAPFAGDRAFERERVVVWGKVTSGYARVQGCAARSEEMAERVDALSAPFAGDREFEVERTDAWRQVAWGYSRQEGGAARSLELAERVDTLLGLLGADRDVQLVRAELWTHVTLAYAKQEGGAVRSEELAERVDALAAPFVGDREFEIERIRAWQYVTFAYGEQEGSTARTEELAERVESLSLPFAGDPAFEVERIRAWCHVTFASSRQAGGAARTEELAERVETLSLPFAGDPAFEFERIYAWRNVTYACAKFGRAARSEELAERVDALAAPFAGERGFELHRIFAWRYATWANSQQEGGAARTEELAEQVDALAVPFAGDREFEKERAIAWRHVALAHAEDGGPAEVLAKRVDTLAERVDTLALPFSGERAFEIERVRVRHAVILAYAKTEGAAARSEEVAERLDTLADRFAGDREFELDRIRGWRLATLAYSNLEGGAAHTEELVERVDVLVAPFSGERDFEFERIRARRHLMFAYARREGGEAPNEVLAERVDALALPFAGDRDFEVERVQAWHGVLSALTTSVEWSREGIRRAEELAAHVDALAAPFAGDPAIELLRASAWRLLACAAAARDPGRAARFAQKVEDIGCRFPDVPAFAGEVLAMRVCFGHLPRDGEAGSHHLAAD